MGAERMRSLSSRKETGKEIGNADPYFIIQ